MDEGKKRGKRKTEVLEIYREILSCVEWSEGNSIDNEIHTTEHYLNFLKALKDSVDHEKIHEELELLDRLISKDKQE